MSKTSSSAGLFTSLPPIVENVDFLPRIGHVDSMVSARTKSAQSLFAAFGTVVSIGGFAMISLLCSCSTATHSFEQPADVPLREWEVGRGMMLAAKVRTENGSEFPCAVDTGSEITSVPSSLEARLGRRLGSGMMNTLDNPKYEPIRFYAAPAVYLGGARLTLGKMVDTGGGSNFILGMDCLRHYCVQLDFGGAKMRFLDPKHLKVEELGKAYPLARSRYAMIRQAGLFGERNSNLLIDTGCPFDGYLVPGLFQEAVQNQHGKPIPISVDGVVKGTVPDMAEFQRCSWDGATYSDLIVGKGPLNLIGMRFLDRHLVTFNFPKNVMYLKRTTADPLK